METTPIEEQILQYVLKNCPLTVFNHYLEEYNLRGIYERRKNQLIAMYFDGSELAYSVEMSKIFNVFQTTNEEQEAKAIHDKMRHLKKEIASKKKYKLFYADLVFNYNELATKKNNLNQGVKTLIKKYKEAHKYGQLKN